MNPALRIRLRHDSAFACDTPSALVISFDVRGMPSDSKSRIDVFVSAFSSGGAYSPHGLIPPTNIVLQLCGAAITLALQHSCISCDRWHQGAQTAQAAGHTCFSLPSGRTALALLHRGVFGAEHILRNGLPWSLDLQAVFAHDASSCNWLTRQNCRFDFGL